MKIRAGVGTAEHEVAVAVELQVVARQRHVATIRTTRGPGARRGTASRRKATKRYACAWFNPEGRARSMGRSTSQEFLLGDKRRYRKFTAQQKAELVLASFRGERSIAEICREHDISDRD